MAQQSFFKPFGAIQLEANVEYSSANIPAKADVVTLLRGVRITDNMGEKTPLRGIRIIIQNNEPLASSPVKNVPFIWLEDHELRFDANYTYTPLDDGIVGYGERIL